MKLLSEFATGIPQSTRLLSMNIINVIINKPKTSEKKIRCQSIIYLSELPSCLQISYHEAGLTTQAKIK